MTEKAVKDIHKLQPTSQMPLEKSDESVRENDLEMINFNGKDLVDLIGKILHCVGEISERHFFGKGVLLNVLRGSSNQQLTNYKLQNTSLYGKLIDVRREDLETIVEWLIANKYLRQRDGKYPVLYLTHDGIHFPEVLTKNQLRNLASTLKKISPNAEILIKKN